MSRDRPINADVPPPEAPADEAPAEKPEPPAKKRALPSPGTATERQRSAQAERAEPEPAPTPRTPPRRRGVPAALKLVAALVALALSFIAAAVIWGTGDGEEEGGAEAPAAVAPAPAPEPPAEEPSPEAPAAEAVEELGFPAFATVNTTRIGGSDAASNAAGAALAVFPSTRPAQRPTAVTLVGEDDWPGAVAAAVLMSAPVRAPLLVSSSDEVPEPTAEALAALAPEGGPETGGSAAFAIGELAAPEWLATTPVGGSVAIGGEVAAAHAAAVARLRDRLFGAPPEHVLVAPLGEPGFAAPAAAWAARSGDPVLFARANRLPQPTRAALARHPKVPVFVLGPSAAISSKVVREIEAIGPPVSRVSGEDPVSNAIGFARYARGDFGWNVNDPGHGFVLARADAPLDAAVAAPLSAAGTWGPLLLTDSAATLPAELRDYFLDVKPGYTTNPTRAFYNHVWLIGDLEAIDVNQQAEVNELAELARIGGEE